MLDSARESSRVSLCQAAGFLMSRNVPKRDNAWSAAIASAWEGRSTTLSSVAVTLILVERNSAGTGKCSVPSKSGSKTAVIVLMRRYYDCHRPPATLQLVFGWGLSFVRLSFVS